MNITASSSTQTRSIKHSRHAGVHVSTGKEQNMTTRDILNDIKSSHSCVEYMQQQGFRVPHSGSCITAPHQIRPDDRNPSFAVYDSGAFDFTTHKAYDLFDLVQALENCSFVQAVQKFDPSLFSPQHPHCPPGVAKKISENRTSLKDKIKKWHEALLKNPVCIDPFTKEHIRALDYLHSRGISDETIEDLMLGYNAEDGFESDHRRIIIPFFRNGQPVYYAGRDLTSRYKQKDPDGKEYGQKYKYCANDDGIEKIVWGLQTLRKPITEHSRKALIADLEGTVEEEYLRDDTLVICEGLLDAAILQQDGWQVLCSGGGAFGRYNIPLVVDIMRMYPQVVLAFDNDKAGKSFARRYGELCIDEHIKFTVAQIPERYGEHSKIKDINDYYLAGAPISELMKQATPGLVYLAQSLKSIDAIHDFVNKCAPFASEYDLQQVKEMLAAKRVDPVTDENGEHIPGMPAVEPMFKSKQLNYAFEEAMKKTPDLVIIERVKRNHNILYSSDNKFYEFTGRAWVRITQQTVVRYVAEAIGPSARSGRCQAIMNFMKAIEESTVPFDTQTIFTFKNGVFLLDKATVPQKDPGDCFVPHNPDFMNTTYVDYEINPYQRWLLGWADHTPEQFKPMQSSADDGHYHAPIEADSSSQITIDAELQAADDTPDKSRKPLAPLWQECCRKWFVDENGNYDPKLERQAQLMAGYCFFPDNRLQKCFMLVGKGSNGKSTFLEVIKELFGRHNCSYLRPDRLTNPFDVMQIRHSMINICHESARSMGGAEEILKAVISGDPITGSYKCQDAESFQSRAKWIIATNSIMDIKDVSYGFLRRMVVIPFNAKFKDSSEPQGRGRPASDKVDYDLLDKLRAELPEIYWWAFYGYWLLKHGHRFEKTADQLMWDQKLRETIDSAYLFSTEGLEDFIRRNSQAGSLTDDREVFKWYANWCKESCNDVAPRYQSIDRIIDAVDDSIPELRVTKLRIEGESAVRKYFIFPDIEIRDWEKFDAPSQEKLRRMGCRLITLEDEERQWLEDERRREEAAEARRKAREDQEQDQDQEQEQEQEQDQEQDQEQEQDQDQDQDQEQEQDQEQAKCTEPEPEQAEAEPEQAKCTDDIDTPQDIHPSVKNEYETPAEVPETAGKAPAGETEEANPEEVSVSSELAELTLKKDEHIARMVENLKDWSPQLSPERRRGRAIQSFIREYPNQEWYKVLTSEEWQIVSDMVKATGEDTFLQRLRDGWVLGHSGQDKQITSDNQEGGTPPETPEPEE